MKAPVALAVAALGLHCALARDAARAQQPRGIAQQAILTRYSPRFSNAQILRRLLSPLAQEAVRDRKLLQDIDSRYGGLAAPRILELARRCACNLAQP